MVTKCVYKCYTLKNVSDEKKNWVILELFLIENARTPELEAIFEEASEMSKRESLAVQIYHLQFLFELFTIVMSSCVTSRQSHLNFSLFYLYPLKYSKYASAIDIRFCFQYWVS